MLNEAIFAVATEASVMGSTAGMKRLHCRKFLRFGKRKSLQLLPCVTEISCISQRAIDSFFVRKV